MSIFIIILMNSVCILFLQSGDEAIIAPLSLFFPELLLLTGPKQICTQGANTGDPTDPHDAEYLRETGVSISNFVNSKIWYLSIYNISP